MLVGLGGLKDGEEHGTSTEVGCGMSKDCCGSSFPKMGLVGDRLANILWMRAVMCPVSLAEMGLAG
ncbi:hypothetical protein RIB2604_02604440 [Aspergillus luchuensis]|uniref:Uncharacterized protein n=1 Tax=Aspergillus kawachii TaxID=1069201 RepID=A0A146FUF0_ASPKA|nr:hypothetical protein RIB2604_02604440 [Aspergillus luchuensis]